MHWHFLVLQHVHHSFIGAKNLDCVFLSVRLHYLLEVPLLLVVGVFLLGQ